jgi:maltose alpha-D-glucosyltransferase/alpha-amylase
MEVFYELRRRYTSLPVEAQPSAEQVLALEGEVMRRFRLLVDRRVQSTRIRCHGNLHLAQVLFTGKDFALVDFEGQATASLPERRTKRSVVKDLASMLRSFHYASLSTYHGLGRSSVTPQAIVREEDRPRILPWMEFWYRWVTGGFLKGYFDTAGSASFAPQSSEERQILFDAYMLERALRELAFELQHRPLWAVVPLAGILNILEPSQPPSGVPLPMQPLEPTLPPASL